MPRTLGIIGGSGLYTLDGLDHVEVHELDTPYGPPSGPVTTGETGHGRIAFLARHGQGHRLNPTEVPYRANIHALKQLDVTHLLGISAVGSLQEHLPPGTMVVPDQIIDRTVQRKRTFFENGMVAHVGIADPFCDSWRNQMLEIMRTLDLPGYDGGTYVCIEGPQFSTRSESQLYRSWQADVIGMTAMPEARLAREAGMCYAIVATVTDYDVWHQSEDDVTAASVFAVLAENAGRSKLLIGTAAGQSLCTCESGCAEAASSALTTDSRTLSPSNRALLEFLTSSPLAGAGS